MKAHHKQIWGLLMAFFCSFSILSPAWGLPVIGRADTFEDGTTMPFTVESEAA